MTDSWEEGYPLYSLRLARYRAAAEAIHGFIRESGERTGKRYDLLDVGVGRGRVMRYLQAYDTSHQVRFCGVDKSQRRLGTVYKFSRWRLQRADAEQGLPFAANSFDIVVCEQVLEHLSRPEAAIREIIRVAHPGAIVIIGVPIFSPGLAALRRNVVPAIDKVLGNSRSHLQAFSLRSFVRFLASPGELEINSVYGFRFISGGPLRSLAKSPDWYLLNRWLGRTVPAFATEIQVVARRSGSE